MAGLPAGGSAYLALAAVSPAAVFAGVGAVSAQLASTRRLALELSAVAFTLGLLALVPVVVKRLRARRSVSS